MWFTLKAEPTEEKTLSQVWIDLECVADTYLRDIHVEIRVGDEHFVTGEEQFLGSCERKSNKSFCVCLRRMSPGALYVTALHEIGHALGLEHRAKGVMSAYKWQRSIPLSAARRRRWLKDFCTQLLTQALAQRIK